MSRRPSLRCNPLILFAAALWIAAPAALGGPPKPVPYREIPDPPDDAERRIVVRAEDRGPVWLYTGFLNNYHPDMDFDMIARLKPRHWRYDLWPFWYSVGITESGRTGGRTTWQDPRDSPVYWATYLDAMLRLREQGMTWQVVMHHKGPFYGRMRIEAGALQEFREHMRLLVKYAHHMGVPIDYHEISNEPGVGPYEGVKGFGFQGTWEEFLGMWDTAYEATRDAYPEAKIVGPSYGSCIAETMEPFLAHCKQKGQKLDVLSWHEITQEQIARGRDYSGPAVVRPDMAHKNIDAIRTLVETKYAMLGVKEIHIDEWGCTIEITGPGTQIAYFHYFDQAGVDRAAKSHWTENDLDGILVSPRTPRTSYWAWAEYAKQDGGLRLVTETNDRCVVALASRHEDAKTVRAVVARSKRHSGEDVGKRLPPVKVTVSFEGIPIDGPAEVMTLRLGPYDGPLWEEDLPALTSEKTMSVIDGALAMTFDAVAENQVYSVRIAPPGTRAREEAKRTGDARQRKLADDVRKGVELPHLLFEESFEKGFAFGETILGKRGWMHLKNKTSALRAIGEPKVAHGGKGLGRFTENYWATNDCLHGIPGQSEGVLEVTAWYRFPGYEGNRDGKGLGAAQIGLCETPDRSVDRNYVTFKLGTHEQNGYSVVIFNNGGARRINWTDASGLRQDVRGKWHQVGLVVDMHSKRVIARHRPSAKSPWTVFHEATYSKMDWTPKYVLISAYNQAPDWHFCVDDVEVRSSVGAAEAR